MEGKSCTDNGEKSLTVEVIGRGQNTVFCCDGK